MSSKLSPSNVLGRVKTRAELRAFLRGALPGWDRWFERVVATLYWRSCEEELRSEADLTRQLGGEVDAWVKGLGAEAENLFGPFAQVRPALDPAGGDGVPGAPNESKAPTLAYVALQRRHLPPESLIRTLGALGLVRRRPPRRGRPRNERAEWALEIAAEALAEFTEGRSAERQRVLPSDSDRDPEVDERVAIVGPIPLALIGVVSVYLALPPRDDPSYFDSEGNRVRDPELLELPANALEDTLKRLRELFEPGLEGGFDGVGEG